jgi:hypothetical protein
MSSLNNFGAILTHAIELEEKLRDYYQGIGNTERADASERRRENLTCVRQDNVVEIMLEPIEGLHEDNYALNLSDTSAKGQATVEEIAARFYTDVAPKINIREARRALERCARQHGELAQA